MSIEEPIESDADQTPATPDAAGPTESSQPVGEALHSAPTTVQPVVPPPPLPPPPYAIAPQPVAPPPQQPDLHRSLRRWRVTALVALGLAAISWLGLIAVGVAAAIDHRHDRRVEHQMDTHQGGGDGQTNGRGRQRDGGQQGQMPGGQMPGGQIPGGQMPGGPGIVPQAPQQSGQQTLPAPAPQPNQQNAPQTTGSTGIPTQQ